jgi:hypothetical protein
MNLAAALLYWFIVAMWAGVLVFVVAAFFNNSKAFGTTRLLLMVVGIDTLRNIVENVYFGTYFGAQFGLFSPSIVPLLGKPALLIIPKVMNVIAGCAVLWLLLFRWRPMAFRERAKFEAELHHNSGPFTYATQENEHLPSGRVSVR